MSFWRPRLCSILIACLGLAMCGATRRAEAAQAPLVGASVNQFFIQPDTQSDLVFTLGAGISSKCELRDYWGRELPLPGAAVVKGEALHLSITLPAGYYELSFPEAGQTFGIVSLAAHQGDADPFFGIDAALSWLDRDPAARAGMIRMLKRSGIAFARERMGLNNVNPSSEKLDFDTPRQFDAVRREYAAQGIPVLDMIDGVPPYLRSALTAKENPYGDQLAEIAEVWKRVAGHYGASWGAVEISNEPELKPWPADQYVPLAKVTAYAMEQAGSKVPIGGGVFGGMPPGAFHEVCSASGMLDVVDFVSFHTYDAADNLGPLVAQYRAWLKTAGKETMPLWLTELGKPWTIGPPRAPLAEDAACALAMVGLTVEARANGVARVCAFVLPFYEEGGLKSFSMLGKERSPMRAMAAYANVIRVLSNQPYVGDLAVNGVANARVFGMGEEQLVVLYTKEPTADARVVLDWPVLRAEGIDGRPVTIGADGAVPIVDGATYVWAKRSDLASRLTTDSESYRLYQLSQQPAPVRPAASPVILQHPLATEKGKRSPRRYLLDAATAKAMPLHVRVDNIGATPQKVTLTPSVQGASFESKSVEVAAGGHAVVQWTLDAGGSLDVAEMRLMTVNAKMESGIAVAPLAIPYQMSGDLDAHLARNSYRINLPITDAARWRPNIVDHGRIQFEATADLFRFNVSYEKPGERWAYPRFELSESIDKTRARGVLMRARILKPGRNVAVMVMQNGKPGFWALEVMPADGEWHVCYVPFSDLQAMPGNPDMQNSIINPAAFTGIQVGMKSETADNAMEVSHLMIVGP